MFTGFSDFSELVRSEGFDIVMVTETWLNGENVSAILSIPGYSFCHKDRLRGRGGGVAAYVSLKYDYSLFEFDFQTNEQLEYLIFKTRIQKRVFAFCVFYRPPNTNINTFLDDFDNIFSTICISVDEVVCLGDFNVDFFNVSNPVSNCFQAYNLTQILNEPSRISGRSSTLIDPIFVSDVDLVTSTGTLPADTFSDHRLVYCELLFNVDIAQPMIITYRCFDNFNYQSFSSDLISLPWYNFIRQSNIDLKLDIFNQFITSLFDKHAPLKQSRITKRRAPWLTPNLKLIMKERDKALQKFKRSNNADDWVNYKQLRNFTLSVVRKEKRAYLKSICEKHCLRKTWSTMKSLNICRNSNASLPNHLCNPNLINNYFSSYYQHTTNNCDDKIKFYSSNILSPNLRFTFSMVTTEDVNKILHSLESTSLGIDNISIKMLKYCSPFIDKYILHLVNYIVENSSYPTIWKEAIGIPIPKKTNPQEISDLRVISILPAISKIVDKILFNQIYSYFVSNKLLPDSQCGFRKGYSTGTALANVTSSIIKAQDEGLVSVLVLLDFSKAFDTISHDLLVSKLNYYGFDESSLALVTSYLIGRYVSIKCGSEFSERTSILSGVPQGSVLGPLFFIIYSADILQSIKKCQVQAYADDMQLFLSFKSCDCERASAVINQELETINSHSFQHGLNFNAGKSYMMVFGSKHGVALVKDTLNISINGIKLTFVDNYRNLGLVLDSRMRYREHIVQLMQKAYAALRILYANRNILNFKLKKMLCESLVLSHFNYCDFIYGPCLDLRDRGKVQKVQNTCVRLIYGLRKYDHVSSYISNLKWLNMNSRRDFHLCNFLIRLLRTEHSSTLLKNFFVPRYAVHDRQCRFRDKFTIPQHRTALYKRSFVYNAITIYNRIPGDILAIEDLNCLKNRLKQYFFNL